RKPAVATSATVAPPVTSEIARIDGPWTVSFQPGRGAPSVITLPKLAPLDKHADARVRYFSGVATYSTTFTLPPTYSTGAPLTIGLGSVGDVAEVHVNGHLVGTAWHAPWRIDAGLVAKPGRNRIEVKVANLWVNRLIGDAQPGAQKVTFTS
ncbi:glycosylhydrolase-like jelly roll fold domain-containing protein, partial [Bradyrhizobium sp. NBAIM08]|uniref:glycosylhydrolase-like jelly roll fold domain-containing protein n=1 Tax=Bradyrhizobium sp. NBAIM08 TaxID=2793815 RepID=UPI001CD1C141